jgi:hypothetical protein|tara:strand:+ start:1974 stop:2153 length:180 start_codon:yes stop_codon:yes gene_type:complete
MSKRKNYLKNFMLILIGVNFSSILYGTAMGSQDMVVTGGLSMALCGFSIYAKGKSDEQE